MKATRRTKSAPTTKWIVGIVVLAGMAALLTSALHMLDSKKTGPLATPALVTTGLAAETAAAAPSEAGVGGGSAAAMQQAASANKHLFVFVHEGNGGSTMTLRKDFEAALGRLADQAQWTAVDRTEPGEKAFVDKYGLASAPMPLVLAVAPNGAITGGFPATQGTEERFREALASPSLQQCLKALQDRRLVMVCLQNARTQANEEAMKGVNDFKANSQFASITEIVKVDPSDAKETKLLAQLKADPQAKTATTAFLAPPGVLVAKVEGPTTKDALVASLQKAMAACASGAGSSCCPPPKK